MIPRIITNTTVTVHLDGDIIVANESHPAFAQIRQAALQQDWETVKNLADVGKAIEVWSDGEFEIKDNTVCFRGERVPDSIERRILGFIEEEAPFEHLLAFYRNLQENPSRRSVEELYKFLEHENIPIGEDGCFYAYKSVRLTWMDWHSNTCHNGIGTTLEMPRNKVDDDANRGCSYGYHVGSLAYASSFGGQPGVNARLLIVRVNPAHVVSVPHDCAHQKVRTSKYTVVQEYTGPLPEVFWTPGTGHDDGVFPSDETDAEVARLEAEISGCEDQIARLQTALDAAEDAEMPTSVINQYCNAIADVERELNAFECELEDVQSDELGEW